MYYDLPKLSPQPQYIIERSVTKTSPVPEKGKDPFNEPAKNADNLGGLFVGNASGTTVTASDISPSFYAEVPVSYVPEFGPLPEVEMEKQYMNEVMS